LAAGRKKRVALANLPPACWRALSTFTPQPFSSEDQTSLISLALTPAHVLGLPLGRDVERGWTSRPMRLA
jgi:hypothetical protein